MRQVRISTAAWNGLLNEMSVNRELVRRGTEGDVPVTEPWDLREALFDLDGYT